MTRTPATVSAEIISARPTVSSSNRYSGWPDRHAGRLGRSAVVRAVVTESARITARLELRRPTQDRLCAPRLMAVRRRGELDADGVWVASPHFLGDGRLAGGDRGLREIVRPNRPGFANGHVVRLPGSGAVCTDVRELRPRAVPAQVLGGSRYGRFGRGRL